MQMKLKGTLILVVFLYIIIISKSVKKKNIQIGYLVFWLITGIGLIIALLIPNLVENVSSLLGFEAPSNMIFCIAIFIILAVIFNLMKIVSKDENKITMLIQEVSILKKSVEELKQNQKEK